MNGKDMNWGKSVFKFELSEQNISINIYRYMYCTLKLNKIKNLIVKI